MSPKSGPRFSEKDHAHLTRAPTSHCEPRRNAMFNTASVSSPDGGRGRLGEGSVIAGRDLAPVAERGTAEATKRSSRSQTSRLRPIRHARRGEGCRARPARYVILHQSRSDGCHKLQERFFGQLFSLSKLISNLDGIGRLG